jgi:hypothetical protein
VAQDEPQVSVGGILAHAILENNVSIKEYSYKRDQKRNVSWIIGKINVEEERNSKEEGCG